MAALTDNVSVSTLESPEQARLLDLIDSLRSQGISKQIGLPQLIVCGDQSSGKSSVLNAITRLKFPANMGVCTTFPTELRLRRGPQQPMSVTIQAGSSRTEEQRSILQTFQSALSSPEDFPQIVERARDVMCQVSGGNSQTIFDDVLCVEIIGPAHSPLTIVDLPGLIHSRNDGQESREGPRIEYLVNSYMSNPRSVILAVVNGQNDLALQKVLTLAEQNHDPKKSRTFGIITKPDRIEEKITPEHSIIQLAKNKRRPLQLGWHVLRNRSPEVDLSDEGRDEQERAFFKEEPWTSLPPNTTGISALCKRLTKILLRQIRTELPSLLAEIRSGITKCETQLSALGQSRDSPREQAAFLSRIGQEVQSLTRDAIYGHYASDSFFANPLSDEGFAKRLRSVIQILNDDYRICMQDYGHKWEIETGDVSIKNKASARRTQIPDTSMESIEKYATPPFKIFGDTLINHVNCLLQRTRGTEFPGTTSSAVVIELFREHSERWGPITAAHLERVWNASRLFLEFLIEEKASVISEPLMAFRVDRIMQQRKYELEKKLQELLSPYSQQHPTMLGDSYVKRMVALHNKRLHAKVATLYDGDSDGPTTRDIAVAFERKDDVSISRHGSLEIIDQMVVYYEYSREIFISNVCSLALENCLISKLPDIISSSYISSLSDKDLNLIAGDSDEVRFERMSLNEKLSALQEAHETIAGDFPFPQTSIVRELPKPTTTRPRRYAPFSRTSSQSSAGSNNRKSNERHSIHSDDLDPEL